LAALTAPAQKPMPAWNDDDLADDVATLSYENALRAHGRYRAVDPLRADSSDRSFPQPIKPEPVPAGARRQVLSHAASAASEATPEEGAAHASSVADSEAEAETAIRPSARLERNLKDASVTIRLSKAECAQLHQRAAEAGLTVSAYLRSCTFEAETLRAMVKDTMARLRATSTEGQPADSPDKLPRIERRLRSILFGWMKRLIPCRVPLERIIRA
jgi:predicted DNA binding CopG/RHH family protein